MPYQILNMVSELRCWRQRVIWQEDIQGSVLQKYTRIEFWEEGQRSVFKGKRKEIYTKREETSIQKETCRNWKNPRLYQRPYTPRSFQEEMQEGDLKLSHLKQSQQYWRHHQIIFLLKSSSSHPWSSSSSRIQSDLPLYTILKEVYLKGSSYCYITHHQQGRSQ